MARAPGSSAGNTRGLIEASRSVINTGRSGLSSAGNTRGLIEAGGSLYEASDLTGLPRGIPAASLKPREADRHHRRRGLGLPRGVLSNPEMSLKRGT